MDNDTKLEVICGADVTVRNVSWLWKPYIPSGKITIIQGDPGEGKSTFVLALAALLTSGESLPFSSERREPVNVIYQNTEDDLEDTIMPRFLQYGGDPNRLFFISERREALTFADSRIIEAIQKMDAKLLIFDPLSSYLGQDVSMNLANEVRARFNRLIDAAKYTGCAIIVISHMNKMIGAKAIYRTSGSVDVIGAARSGLAIGTHPEDPALRVMTVYKSNLAEKGMAIVFSVGDKVEWIEQIDMTADELMGSFASSGSRKETKRSQAKTLLLDILKDGPRPQCEIMDRLKSAGIGQRTVEMAKADLHIQSVKNATGWLWKMP